MEPLSPKTVLLWNHEAHLFLGVYGQQPHKNLYLQKTFVLMGQHGVNVTFPLLKIPVMVEI